MIAAYAGPRQVEVPPALKPAANESLSMIVSAIGVQIYECRPAKDAGHEWVFVAPEAELFDAHGKTIGRHFEGPYWQATDGSLIVGAVKERADAPLRGAIPWLLLTARSEGPPGLFSAVTSVQRVNTEGGAAPAAPCTREASGTTARIDYSADYHLYTAR